MGSRASLSRREEELLDTVAKWERSRLELDEERR